ncbi:MAG TPA: RnfABCDGE type electron transport complex subunit D [Spirochaetota bacterium]|nr:RnfABCDGE type electron transport complex subunit D [Spirochaetota bacterium]HNT09930.1 RnfABCDGE type electron transport complex subunit D [Spirochaetota bacterium]HNV45861.1 RnfABCDGE type electron transport complex subunit D [Spirochaetota bacterium]HOS40866.1 RnfABCDGE type electron transport complex subunit D [Spirochaetota bacterium]HPI21757.1 RnfABCDGE type electron transport complex subunit D [Spirochaetota bacterium]
MKTGILIAGSSPHLRSDATARRIMLDVLIALVPATAAAVYFFGVRAALVIAVTTAASVLAEFVSNKIMKKPITIGDLSAAVTGLLLAFNLPPGIPLWVAAIGGVFAIVVAKQLFGGLGMNFINPALAARAFLMASWPVFMTTWTTPMVDAVSSATPLAIIKSAEAAGATPPSIAQLFLGNVAGCLGETSALAILVGAAYLVVRRVITLETPLAFIGTVAAMTWVLGGKGLFSGDVPYHLFAGGLMLGAFFMATDYPTSPITWKGKIIFGVGCGLLTSVIRLYGGYPEGVCYSILLMNLAVPIIDKFTVPKSFGGA